MADNPVQQVRPQQYVTATPGTQPAYVPPAANTPAWQQGWADGGDRCVMAPYRPPAVQPASPFSVRSPLGMYADQPVQLPGPRDRPFVSPYAGGATFTGITNGAADARQMADTINGNRRGVALYEGTNFGVPVPFSDAPYDAGAVQTFANMGNNVQVTMDENGQPHLNVDQRALSSGVASGIPTLLGPSFEFYQSPMQIGNAGADAALSSPEMQRLLGGQNQANDSTRDMFIPLTGHSGGGQSSFYSAIELYQRGFRNLSVTGYEMAMSPHQREVLEQLGIPVTNMTGHNGDDPNSGWVGNLIRDQVNGGMPYDISIDRGPVEQDGAGGMGTFSHSVTNNERVVTALRFQQYLDANGQHGDFNPAMYRQFLQDNPNGDFVWPDNRMPVHSQSPVSGTTTGGF